MQNPFPNPESNRPEGGYFRSPETFSSARGTAAPNQSASAPYQAAPAPCQTGPVPVQPSSYQTGPVPVQPSSYQTGPVPVQPSSYQTGPVPVQPAPTPAQAHPAEAYTHHKKGRRSSRRRSLWLYLFAGIGILAVGFVLVRYLIIPLLVMIG